MKLLRPFLLLVLIAFLQRTYAQEHALDKYNITWTTQSTNSAASMPCGGGDVGLNVWVENGDLLLYVSRSGAFDENNTLLKLGRVRIKIFPNPFNGSDFKQELVLKDGYIKITGGGAEVSVWVDVFRPVAHIDIKTNKNTTAEASYESWRHQDRTHTGNANNANSYKWIKDFDVKTYKDEISFDKNSVVFYHRNKPAPSVFDITVKQQGMEHLKDQLYNPIYNLTSGGSMEGSNMQPAGTDTGTYTNTDYKRWTLKSRSASRSHRIALYMHVDQSPAVDVWKAGLDSIQLATRNTGNVSLTNTRNWWKKYWERSFIYIRPENRDDSSADWQSGRNYQLFRYMLGCNAYGQWPTKFNGGLLTYDPVFVNRGFAHTPDFRNWGGGVHTAQNQRLVYFPMLKSGDFDMMRSQFLFYTRILGNAELRSKTYWNHEGACFTEQMENFGLPNMAEYGWDRPDWFAKGVEYNAWLEYEWDTVLEFCLMMLETERYANHDISEYIPFIESCLKFFDAHYQYLGRQLSRRALDQQGHLVLYPGSGAETFKMAYNATSTIAALKTVTSRMLALPEKYVSSEKRKSLDSFLRRIPPISFASFNGHPTIAPAKTWARVNNEESPQLYTLFPWGVYGIGKPGLDTALNTWKYDTNVVKFKSHVGWKQDNIFAARLGLAQEAASLTFLKLKNSGRRFPAFWGPGFDWTPDHNWGGSGMIGLQEMLLQTDDRKIYLFPAWPRDIDVHFKLHAPYETTVEARIQHGKAEIIHVMPEERRKDIIISH